MNSAVVSGGGSGLGLATVRRLLAAGARVTVIDRVEGDAIKSLGPAVRSVVADVTDEGEFAAALDQATEIFGPVRALVHTAGRGGKVRLVERDGRPGDVELFEAIMRVNVVGTFNALRLGAALMSANEPVAEERGALVLTASIAAFEGQIGQIAYAASKAAIVGMTVTAARDLASRGIRVCTIAPGIFATPLFDGLRPDVKATLEQAVPQPRRLGDPDEFAALAEHIIANPYLNGETIRLDGAIRMGPR
jgi:NAD(P)-dependent dehydrogenase (short-subunit alcohol dehydrogenase family)